MLGSAVGKEGQKESSAGRQCSAVQQAGGSGAGQDPSHGSSCLTPPMKSLSGPCSCLSHCLSQTRDDSREKVREKGERGSGGMGMRRLLYIDIYEIERGEHIWKCCSPPVQAGVAASPVLFAFNPFDVFCFSGWKVREM